MQHAGVIPVFGVGVALWVDWGSLMRDWPTYTSDAGPHRDSRSLALTSQAGRTLRQSAPTLYPGTDAKRSLRPEDFRKNLYDVFPRK